VLVNHAEQMGAVYKADLRSDVTHMIVGNVETPKYQVCNISEIQWLTVVCCSKSIRPEDHAFRLGRGSI
jgi:hypothetical protein